MNSEKQSRITGNDGLDITWENSETLITSTTLWDDNQASEGKNLIAEMQQLEREIKNPHNKTFTKSTYWNKLKTELDDPKQDVLLQEITHRLERMEEKLEKIEHLLIQAKSEKSM